MCLSRNSIAVDYFVLFIKSCDPEISPGMFPYDECLLWELFFTSNKEVWVMR